MAYLTAEIFDFAEEELKDKKRKMITEKSIRAGIAKDPLLSKFYLGTPLED